MLIMTRLICFRISSCSSAVSLALRRRPDVALRLHWVQDRLPFQGVRPSDLVAMKGQPDFINRQVNLRKTPIADKEKAPAHRARAFPVGNE